MFIKIFLIGAAIFALLTLASPIGPVSLSGIPALAWLGVCLAILTSWVTNVRGAPSRPIAQVLYARDPQ